MSSGWLRTLADGSVVLTLHVHPNAKNTGFAGRHGEAIKLRLAAPPVDGKANAAMCAFVADFCNVSRASVTLIRGHTSRLKSVHIETSDAAVIARLRALQA